MAKFTWQQEEDFMKATTEFRMDEAMEWIRNNLYPEDVFNEEALEKWAENNDYIKE